MQDGAPQKHRETIRLVIFVACFLAVPALVSQFIPLRTHFDKQPIARLRAQHPDVVILSDSIVDNGVDPQLLGRSLQGSDPGPRVELLWYGGASSASWFFQLKNHVIASGLQPRLVCIFFRDRMLTNPTFPAPRELYRAKLEAAMHEDEPVYRQVLGAKDKELNRLSRLIELLYPLVIRIVMPFTSIWKKMPCALSRMPA